MIDLGHTPFSAGGGMSQRSRVTGMLLASLLLWPSVNHAESSTTNIRLSAVLSVPASLPGQTIPLYEMALPAEAIGTLRQGKPLQILNGQGQAVPMAVMSPPTTVNRRSVALSLYRWPESELPTSFTTGSGSLNSDAQNTANTAAGEMRLELSQGNTSAILRFPERTPIVLNREGTGRQWLLANPAHLGIVESGWQADRLKLQWPRASLAVNVSVEGSSDLVNWVPVSQGRLLETSDAQGRQLSQTELSLQGEHYPYWRLILSQPLALQAAIQTEHQDVLPAYLVTPVNVTTDTPNRFQITLPQAVAMDQLTVRNLPDNQLIPAQLEGWYSQPSNHLADWHLIAEATLQHWTPQALAGKPTRLQSQEVLPLSHDVFSRQYRLTLENWPAGQLPHVELLTAPQTVKFLAQGQPPYTLYLNPANPVPAIVLPDGLQETPGAKAQIQGWQVAPEEFPWKRYALWLLLIVLVAVLGIAAMRLLKQLPKPMD